MRKLVIAEWDKENRPTKTMVFSNQKEVTAWFDKNKNKYPKAIYGKAPEKDIDSKFILVSQDEKSFSFESKRYKEEAETQGVIRARKQQYPNTGDQLDAIWKQLNQDRLNGKNLIQEADDRLNEVLAVKARNPKPTKEEK